MSFAGILKKLDTDARGKLEAKLPSWAELDIQVPQSLNYQQCSSESTAKYKASLVSEGARVADLTGGLGADSWAFSQRASALWFNERDAVLLDAVRHNFALLGVQNAVFNNFDIDPSAGGWMQSLMSFGPDVIYLDPARRSADGRKLFLLEDCSPDVLSLMPGLLEVAPQVMIKVSPMADITMLRRRLEGVLRELHVVGSEGECKELLCICGRDAEFDGVVLAEDGVVYENVDAVSDGPMLFVPSAAMVKSGLGPGMCLMGFDEGLTHFGKFYQVLENLPFASSVIKEVGRRYPQAEVTARGVQIGSEALRAKMKTKPGGPVHIFACILNSDRRLIVCRLFEEHRSVATRGCLRGTPLSQK